MKYYNEIIWYTGRGVCKKTTGPPAPPAAGPTFVPHRRPVGPLVFLCIDHRPYVRNVLEWFYSWVVKCGRETINARSHSHHVYIRHRTAYVVFL